MKCDEMEYKLLANAIIMQAVKDYEDHYRELKALVEANRDDEIHRQQYLRHCLEKIDAFFDGEWCAALSKDDVSRSWRLKRAEIRNRIGETE